MLPSQEGKCKCGTLEGSAFHLQSSMILINQVTDQLKSQSGSDLFVGSWGGFQLPLIPKLFQDLRVDAYSGIGDGKCVFVLISLGL